jgi:4-amino-4-deoxy-L-arabinose transferase-like glycosyltransferase
MEYFLRRTTRSALLMALFVVAGGTALAAFRPLWVDEIVQLIETRQPSVIRLIEDLPRTPGAAPLGYLVQQAGLRITGYSALRARMMPILFASASTYVVVLLAAELGLMRPWVAGVVFAAFPLTLRYGTESRVYSQALFSSVIATLLHVRMARRPEWKLAGGCCLALVAAVYTHPYAAFVGLAHLLWSALSRNQRSAQMSALALVVAGLAFLPWFLWARTRWTASIAETSVHFQFSEASPLMIFRESIGLGYWGTLCLVLLCGLSVVAGSQPQISTLAGLIVFTVMTCAVAADAAFDYFLAARQFLWILPSVAILAATAIERNKRSTLVLAILLGFFCVRQSALFFLFPKENWQAAADFVLDQVHQGAHLVVVPPVQERYYMFFHPELCCGAAASNQIVMAITPYATGMERMEAIAATIAAGYEMVQERDVGGSHVVSFRKR